MMSTEITLCLNCGCVGEYNCINGDISNIKHRYKPCPNCNDKENVIGVDEELAWYIYQLNKAGFKTNFCCSGHSWEYYSRFYISFKEDYKELKEYFDKNKSNIKVLNLTTHLYGNFEGINGIVSVEENINTTNIYDIKFIPNGKKHFRINLKNESELFDKCCSERFQFIDHPDNILLKHDIFSDLKNIVTNLCIK